MDGDWLIAFGQRLAVAVELLGRAAGCLGLGLNSELSQGS